jgi:TDG/mug DNA glycosylase family protein
MTRASGIAVHDTSVPAASGTSDSRGYQVTQTVSSRGKPLRDHVKPGLRVLFVGINPGMRSAAIGHHFAGYSNRFWKLLFESKLVPEPIRAQDDARLTEWGYGITNLVPRMTPGIDALRPEEYAAGLRVLRRKVRRWRPERVVFLGVTMFRVVFGCRPGVPVPLGPQEQTFEGASVFVLPNPSGRNANYSYAEMLRAFEDLRRRATDSSDPWST